MKSYKPLLANVAAQTIFGLGYFFIKMGMAVVDQDTVKFLSFRFTLGFLAMTLILLLKIQKVDYKKGFIGLIFLCGLFNPAISQILETTSTSYAPTSQIAMYNSMLPIVMLIFSALINKEYPTRRQLGFVLVCVAGVFIANMVEPDVTGMTKLGLILIIGTNVAVAINRVLVRRASAVFTSFEIIYITTGMGALLFNLISVGRSAAAGTLPAYFDGLVCPEFAVAVLYMGIGSCVIAFLSMTYASANLPFAVYASTCTLSTVVAIISGIFLLHETFTAVQAVGTAVILVGIVGISLSYDKKDAEGNRYHLEEKKA
ncbi:MAG TPA: DMT family transporter [Candidatus Copromonas avistercoris]|nr:DMT family transporter [Candidatus Copromonas avistercoris]